MQPPRIYNLFPRLIGALPLWTAHARRARAMGFDWLYVNPFHFPGFSGSIYAVKDYRRLDPLLLPAGHPDHHYRPELRGDGGMALLAETVAAIRASGLRPMMDLVINHTARDALLAGEHPEWYAHDAQGAIRSPSAIDPADARRVTVWGDLAEIDHAGTRDREGLWGYLEQLVRTYARLGFEGFRCDAAYLVPAALWQRLMAAARAERPGAVFFAETLGARLEQIESLRAAGFDFIFNSSKWWDYEAPWCLEQQRAHRQLAPSVSFPESHDTPRLWAETGGSLRLQEQRYAFAAAFSRAVLMPVGYEFGFARPLHVVDTRPQQWEEPAVDLSDFVARVNTMKVAHAALAGEEVAQVSRPGDPVLVLEKCEGDARAWVVVNKDADGGRRWQPAAGALGSAATALRAARVLRPCRAESGGGDDGGGGTDAGGGGGGESAARGVELQGGEVVYLVDDR